MKKLIGTRKFYATALALMIPIMIQNGITNFVNMLDNLMVGQLGTSMMSGVAVANQLIVVYNLCIFGVVSGAGIFGAQFYGKGDTENLRNTFRFKMVFGVLMAAASIGIFLLFGRNLSALYLKGDGNPENAAVSLDSAYRYIKIMVIGFIPYSLSQTYASTLRETGKTLPPMIAGLIAVFVNLFLNYVFIFGHFGVPAMGVEGAAFATVVSRFAELGFIAFWTFKNRLKNTFIIGIFRNFRIPISLSVNIFKKAFPLTVNETMWAAGQALLAQCYSVKGLDVVAANNICHTFWLVFSVVALSVATTIAIMTGQLLGAGKHEEAKDTAMKLIVFSSFLSALCGMVFASFSGIIPRMYNTTESVRLMAKTLIIITSVCMPIDAFSQACYFTLRSGGKVFLTMMFDSWFVCFVTFPVIFVLANFTGLGIYPIYFIAQMFPLVKCAPGFILVKKGIWLNTLSAEKTL